MYLNTQLTDDEMKQISFQIKAKHDKTVLLLTSDMNEKPLISLMISDDLVEEMQWNAGQFIRDLSKLIKGGGGGQAFFASAGGSDVKGLTLLKEKAKSLFEEYIELYPNGYNPYDSMGEFYYNEGDLENAKLYYSKAVEKYYAATTANGRLSALND